MILSLFTNTKKKSTWCCAFTARKSASRLVLPGPWPIVLTGDEFALTDIPDLDDDESRQVLIERLVREGLVLVDGQPLGK